MTSEQLRMALMAAQSGMFGQFESLGEWSGEAVGRVGDGRLEAGVEFARRGQAAHRVRCFKHQDLVACPCQEGGADQSVVAATNDNRVVLHPCWISVPGRWLVIELSGSLTILRSMMDGRLRSSIPGMAFFF